MISALAIACQRCIPTKIPSPRSGGVAARPDPPKGGEEVVEVTAAGPIEALGVLKLGTVASGRHQGARQREPAQRAVVETRLRARSPVEGRGWRRAGVGERRPMGRMCPTGCRCPIGTGPGASDWVGPHRRSQGGDLRRARRSARSKPQAGRPSTRAAGGGPGRRTRSI